jgi:hypothetical protein
MILLALLLIAAGALAIPALIAAKQPNAKEVLDKLVPYQGIIGIILLIMGLYLLFVDVLSFTFSVLRAISPLGSILYMISILVAIALGLLLGYGLIKKYVLSKNADAASSGDMMMAKLARIQAPLGIAGIALGVFLLIWRFILLPSYMSGGLGM